MKIFNVTPIAGEHYTVTSKIKEETKVLQKRVGSGKIKV